MQRVRASVLFTLFLMVGGISANAEGMKPITISPLHPTDTSYAPHPLHPGESVSFTVTVESDGTANDKEYKLEGSPTPSFSGSPTLWSRIDEGAGNTFQFQALNSGEFIGTDSVTVSATWKETPRPPRTSAADGVGSSSSQPLDTINGWATGFASSSGPSFIWTFDTRLQFADGSPIQWTVSASNEGTTFDLSGATISITIGTVHLGTASSSNAKQGTVTSSTAGVGALEIQIGGATARSEKQIGFALPDLEIAAFGNGANIPEDRLPNGGTASSPHEMDPGGFVIAPAGGGGAGSRSKLTLKGNSGSLDGSFTLKAENLANAVIYTSPTGNEKITLPRTWKSAELPGSLYVGANSFSAGAAVQDGALTLTYKQTLQAGPSDFELADSVRVRLLPIEITKLWSDQLSGVTDANYLPNKTGQADRAYLLMGACQSNNFDLKGHLKAKVNVGSSPELRDKILWRLAGKNGSTYIPENGTSTYNANGDEVTIVLDNPRTDDNNSYYLVAGYDQDENGQLSSVEASVIPKYKWKRKVNDQLRTDDHDYEVKIISRSQYDEARQSLNGLAGTWNSINFRQASRLMTAYLNEQTPTGATAVPVMIGRDEPGLTHSVGVLFAAPGNPGQSITATFGPTSQMTADVLDSTTFNNWLFNQFEQKRQEVASRFQNSEEIIETFVWNFNGNLSFLVESDPDLFFALGRANVDVTVEVEVHRFLYTVESTKVTGSVTDLYDFDYDDRSGYSGYGDFVRKAARVQAGYNTIGTGGRVYKSSVQMTNSPHDIQFQFQ